MLSLNKGNIFLLIEPNSISSIRAVPAIVLKPSGARNTRSPPISWTVLPWTHPIFFVTPDTTGVPSNPDTWKILLSQNTISLLRKGFTVCILSPISIVPAEAPVKSSGFNLVLYDTTCGLSESPASINRSPNIVANFDLSGADLSTSLKL